MYIDRADTGDSLYIVGMVREVKARVNTIGIGLIGEDGWEWKVNQLLVADDTVLVAESEEDLQKLVTEFERVCSRRKLKVNV